MGNYISLVKKIIINKIKSSQYFSTLIKVQEARLHILFHSFYFIFDLLLFGLRAFPRGDILSMTLPLHEWIHLWVFKLLRIVFFTVIFFINYDKVMFIESRAKFALSVFKVVWPSPCSMCKYCYQPKSQCWLLVALYIKTYFAIHVFYEIFNNCPAELHYKLYRRKVEICVKL